jgi:ribose 5-phosphate isomerase A
MTQDEAKLLVARRAVELVSDGMKVGLGTGSTATLFIHELGKAVQGGLRIEAIATSDKSSALAKEVGIPLTNFDDTPVLDVNVDGADEVAPGLALIKGGHGAHLRREDCRLGGKAVRRFSGREQGCFQARQVSSSSGGCPDGAAVGEAPVE